MTAWLAQPFIVKLADLLMGMFTLAFVLIAIGFFIQWLKPSGVSVGKVKVLFGRKNKTEEVEKEEETVQVECSDSRLTLLNHKYFKLMETAQTSGALLLANQSDNPVKNAINMAFLVNCKFKVFADGILDFVKEQEKSNGATLYKISGLIGELTNKYEHMSETLTIFLPDGRNIVGVPECYMIKFNNWHSEHVNVCLDGINETLSDKIYDDWYDQLRSILDYLHIAFKLTLIDAKRTLNSLNGDLDREIELKLKILNS